ncbi:MAG: hypothetical protein IJX62_08960 [Clostridia bacterium]|nr:hypothetical protein [Clostridia bacterium]
MSTQLFKNYRKMIEQAWIPIFVDDDFDTDTLLEGCRLAKLNIIEYTLRRRDADRVIPTLKSRFPDTVILMGSTIDSEEIVRERKNRFPQLMTIPELAPYVDGFVSMLPYSDETLQTYKSTHLCIPTAENGGEALRQVKAGAAIIKVLGPDLSLSKRLHALPTFNYCPTYVTGGITVERMEEAFAAGNILCATGFDVLLKGVAPSALTPQLVAERIRAFVDAAQAARDRAHPSLKDTRGLSDEEFRAALPNYCGIG